MCEQRRQCCHGGWWADADQTSDPRDVLHHHNWGGLRVWGAACHTSSRGRWNQPPHQLLSVQCSSSHKSVQTLVNISCKNVTQLVCTWLKCFHTDTVNLTHVSFSQSSQPQFCHSTEICYYRIKTATTCQTVSLCLYIPGCYGVDPTSVSKEWKCARCKANAMTEVSELSRADLLNLDWQRSWLATIMKDFAPHCWSGQLITCCFCRIAVCVHWEAEPCRRPTTTSKLFQSY